MTAEFFVRQMWRTDLNFNTPSQNLPRIWRVVDVFHYTCSWMTVNHKRYLLQWPAGSPDFSPIKQIEFQKIRQRLSPSQVFFLDFWTDFQLRQGQIKQKFLLNNYSLKFEDGRDSGKWPTMYLDWEVQNRITSNKKSIFKIIPIDLLFT